MVYGLWTEGGFAASVPGGIGMKMKKGILIAPIFALALGAVPSSFAQQLLASASPAAESVGLPMAATASPVAAKPVASKPLPPKLELAAPAPITWNTGSSVGPAPEAAKPGHLLFGLGNKKKATPYTGPTELVVLPPTPMLDEHGQQKLDWDRRPMFNAPDVQLQDKNGHPMFDRAGKPVFASNPSQPAS